MHTVKNKSETKNLNRFSPEAKQAVQMFSHTWLYDNTL